MAVFVGAFALRITYIGSLWSDTAFTQLQVNAARYDTWARMILAGQAPSAPWEQAPGYAYFLSFVYATFGAGPHAVAIVQALISSATCLFIYQIADDAYGRRAARWAGALACLSAPLIYFSGEVLPTTLFLTLCAGAIAVQCGARPTWSFAGILWALAYVVRSNVILAVPFVAIHALRRSGVRALAGVLLPILFSAGMVAGVSTVNEGALVLTTTSRGVNLWLGNNPTADGVNPFFGPDQRQVDADLRATASTAAEANLLFSARAVRFWADEPWDGLTLAGKKLLWTFTNRELPNNVDIDWKRTRSWLFRLPGLPLGFGAVLTFAMLGLVCCRPRDSHGWTLLSAAAIGIGTCVIFFTNARFRIPLLLPLSVIAGAGLAYLGEHRRELLRAPKRLGRAALALLVGALLAWGNWFDVADYSVAQLDVNAGAFEREAKNFPAAIRLLERGLAREPRDPIGWVHLALAREQSGDIEGARQTYREGLEHVPGDPQILAMESRFTRRK